jgi:ADP-ribosylglycohydrolase
MLLELAIADAYGAGFEYADEMIGWMSVRAAITAVMRNDSMSELLQDCIAFTGDVDTVAAIALAAGSCSEEITQDIPNHLVTGLENGTYGRDYLIDLDKQLMSLANKNIS